MDKAVHPQAVCGWLFSALLRLASPLPIRSLRSCVWRNPESWFAFVMTIASVAGYFSYGIGWGLYDTGVHLIAALGLTDDFHCCLLFKGV